jgi:hypothetical protein
MVQKKDEKNKKSKVKNKNKYLLEKLSQLSLAAFHFI